MPQPSNQTELVESVRNPTLPRAIPTIATMHKDDLSTAGRQAAATMQIMVLNDYYEFTIREPGEFTMETQTDIYYRDDTNNRTFSRLKNNIITIAERRRSA